MDVVKHGNVKKVVLGNPFFNLKAFIRIKAKKKKFDKVYRER
jgi:glutaredoxin-related protein